MICAYLNAVRNDTGGVDIDYVMKVADISPWYYGIALLICVVGWLVSSQLRAGVLAGYLFLILEITLLSRTPGIMRYELIPFWSYHSPSLRTEILLNVLLFIPVGILAGKWKVVPAAACFSLFIEIVQLLTGRGLFEFDDVIHNTLGAAIGVFLVWALRRKDDIQVESRATGDKESGCSGDRW